MQTLYPPRAPVADEIRTAIFQFLSRPGGKYDQKEVAVRVTGLRIGTKPGEIIFFTEAGWIPCVVTDDGEWLYFELDGPAKGKKAPRNDFLAKIGFSPPS